MSVDAQRLPALEQVGVNNEVLQARLGQELVDALAQERRAAATRVCRVGPLIAGPICTRGKPEPAWRATEMPLVGRHAAPHLSLNARVMPQQGHVPVGRPTGDDLNAPAWRGQPGTTYQGWDFVNAGVPDPGLPHDGQPNGYYDTAWGNHLGATLTAWPGTGHNRRGAERTDTVNVNGSFT